MKSYTGIGSRKTPDNILEIMELVGKKLAKLNYKLRSGGANGADTAFEKGCDIENGSKEIYLPWEGFNNKKGIIITDNTKARKVAEKNHPDWNNLNATAKKFMIRNSYQVLEIDLNSKSDFVLCWTPDGAIYDNERSIDTGGTGQVISIASKYNIPVYNLKLDAHLDKIKEFLKQG